jgi:hypothetical protein
MLGREGHRCHATTGLKAVALRALTRVPDSNRLVGPSGCHRHAIGVQRYASDGSIVSEKPNQLGTRRWIVADESLVITDDELIFDQEVVPVT